MKGCLSAVSGTATILKRGNYAYWIYWSRIVPARCWWRCWSRNFCGSQGEPNTWRVHAYKGIGKIPKDIGKKANPAKRILLDQLPRLLRGYGKCLWNMGTARWCYAVHTGGSSAIKKAGWPLPVQVKNEWAKKIAPLMDLDRNVSPSFCKFRDGLRQLCTDWFHGTFSEADCCATRRCKRLFRNFRSVITLFTVSNDNSARWNGFAFLRHFLQKTKLVRYIYYTALRIQK